jgi:hypothetical protein
MADDQLRNGRDLRLRAMAHAIRHEQQGEIALLQGVKGWQAVGQAIANMMADRTARQ